VAEFGEFACLSLSNQLVTFDIATERVVSTVDMPTARYRHAAVFVDQRLWLVGGRDEEDGLIGTVDVSLLSLNTYTCIFSYPVFSYFFQCYNRSTTRILKPGPHLIWTTTTSLRI